MVNIKFIHHTFSDQEPPAEDDQVVEEPIEESKNEAHIEEGESDKGKEV